MEPPRDPNTLFIKTVTPTCSRAELLEVLNRVGQPGEQVLGFTRFVIAKEVRFVHCY